jgi:hypothetical protein
MHARRSGLADYFAADELDAIRLGRQIVSRLNWRKLGPVPGPYTEPLFDSDELLDLAPADLRQPFDPREVIARVVDGSRFDEFKPLYGSSLVTGWATLHGYPIGILANARGVLFSEESQKAAQFIQLANQAGVSLLFLHNTTGYMVGRDYEQAGIIKHGAMMINAVSNSRVPHISLLLGGSYGAGNYGMCGRAYDPRFLFAWPSAKSAVMGPAQLAGTLSIVSRQAAAAAGRPFDEDADQVMRTMVENQIEAESLPMVLSGLLYDDGVIDPRDTRIVLRNVLVRHPLRPGRGRDRLRRLQDVRRDDSTTHCGQPWRDRPAGLPHVPRDGDRDSRGVHAARPFLVARRGGRTRGTDRVLFGHTGDRGGGAPCAGGRGAPGVRVPVGERGLRPGGARRRPGLGRPGARGHRGDGFEARGQEAHGRGRRADSVRRWTTSSP